MGWKSSSQVKVIGLYSAIYTAFIWFLLSKTGFSKHFENYFSTLGFSDCYMSIKQDLQNQQKDSDSNFNFSYLEKVIVDKNWNANLLI